MSILKRMCLRCGHSWTARKDKIRSCPKCHSPYWDTPLMPKKRRCSACKFEWLYVGKPKTCPNCEAAY